MRKREERNGIGSTFHRSLSTNSLVSRRKKYGESLTFLGDMRFDESKILLIEMIQRKTLSLICNKTCDSAYVYVGCSGALQIANTRAPCIIIEAIFIKPSGNRQMECLSGKTRYSYTEKSSRFLPLL